MIAGFSQGYRGFLANLTRIWMETSKSKKITLHDPLTVAYLLDPSLVTMEEAPVQVILDSGTLRGLTVDHRHPFRPRAPFPAPNARIAKTVDAGRVRRLVLSRIFETPNE